MLDEEQQFAKYLAQVSTVDLVYDQHILVLGIV